MNTNPLVSSIGYIGNPARIPINHPLADGLSFFHEPDDDECYELAFFKGQEWVIETIPLFSKYAETEFRNMYSRVYRYVPKNEFHDFLEVYKDW